MRSYTITDISNSHLNNEMASIAINRSELTSLSIIFYDSTIIAGKNIYICSPNKSIRDLLNAHYLERCVVKALPN